MELGLALPTAGPQTSPETIVKVAKVVLWTGGEPEMLPEFYGSTYETLSHVVAVTERIKLGTANLVAPLLVPVMLARRLATLDRNYAASCPRSMTPRGRRAATPRTSWPPARVA